MAALCLAAALSAGCASGKHSGEPSGLDGPGGADGPIQFADQGPGPREAAAPDGAPADGPWQPDQPAPLPDSAPAPDLPPPAPDLPPPAPDLGPVEQCGNGKDDDGDQLIDCVDLADCSAKAPCRDTTRTFVLHEVYPGTPDYVVLRNVSSVARNAGAHTLEMHGTTKVTYKLPSVTVGAGQVIRVVENSDGKTGDINSGVNIPFYNGLTSFSNAVVLRSPKGAVLDYVGFGTSLVGLPGGVSQAGGVISYSGYNVSTEAHYRAGMAGKPPAFHKADWVVHTRSY